MPRFFVNKEQTEDGCIRITGSDVNHIRNVLRMKKGDSLQVVTGGTWEYTCGIEAFEDDAVVCRIRDAQKPAKELPSRVILFQCLPKKDKMETVIQKAVELGASAVVPVASRRCVVKLDPKKAEARTVRWNSIARSAAEQSGRLNVPEVYPVMSFSDAVAFAKDLDIRLIPYEKEEDAGSTRDILASVKAGKAAGILIGPEGGFEEAEVQEAVSAGFRPVTLGRRILRTETAGMMLLSVLVYLLEIAVPPPETDG